MEPTPDSPDVVWRPETVTAAANETLRALRERGLLVDVYLAGGTGLALRFGHRRSVDLDFFATDLFDESALLRRVEAMPGFSIVAIAPHTIHATIRATKVSFFGYPYPTLFPFALFEKVPVADPRDIACMKVSAIASRGTKRDFIDLYEASQRFTLAQILSWFHNKYSAVGFSRLHILKSLTFFTDAEKDPMPDMLLPLTWEEVKAFFVQEAPRMLSPGGSDLKS